MILWTLVILLKFPNSLKIRSLKLFDNSLGDSYLPYPLLIIMLRFIFDEKFI